MAGRPHAALQAVAVRLTRECFFDGALGPGTAAVDPRPYLERVRSAYRFEERRVPAPGPIGERIDLAAGVGAAVGWTRLRVRGGEVWEGHVGEADALAERAGRGPHAAGVPRIDVAPLGFDREDKWVGRGLPSIEVTADAVAVDGPPCLGDAVESALDGGG